MAKKTREESTTYPNKYKILFEQVENDSESNVQENNAINELRKAGETINQTQYAFTVSASTQIPTYTVTLPSS